jgi:hypothetical protein
VKIKKLLNQIEVIEEKLEEFRDELREQSKGSDMLETLASTFAGTINDFNNKLYQTGNIIKQYIKSDDLQGGNDDE